MPRQDREDPPQDRIGSPRYFGRMLKRLREHYSGPRIAEFAERLDYPDVIEYRKQERGGIPVPPRDLLLERLSGANLEPEEFDDLILGAGYLLDADFAAYTGEKSLTELPREVFEGAMRELTDKKVGWRGYFSIADALLRDRFRRRP